jgi:hypothetical protein
MPTQSSDETGHENTVGPTLPLLLDHNIPSLLQDNETVSPIDLEESLWLLVTEFRAYRGCAILNFSP